MRLRGVLGVVLWLAVACTAPREETPVDDPVVAAARPSERGPTRAAREAARAPREDDDGDRTDETRPADVAHLTIAPIEAATGEDGHGHVVAATHPVSLDLYREGGWPGRALDPVLRLGTLELTHYRHVSAEVLRYVAADGEALDREAPVYVQWGDDEGSRLDVVLTVDDASGSLDL